MNLKKIIFGESIKKTLARIGWGLVVFYIVLGVVLYLFQRSLIYPDHGRALMQDCPLPAGFELQEFQGERFFENKAGEAVVVIYHGNGDTACNWLFLASTIQSLGHSFIFVEYPGYAGDDQVTSKESLFHTVDAVDQYIENQEYTQVKIVAHSLGGALAAHHASLRPGTDILLLAPFNTLIDVVWSQGLRYPKFLLKDNFDNTEEFLKSDANITIIHGAEDRIVPANQSKNLQDNLKSNLEINRIVIPEGNHVNLFEFGITWDTVVEFLQNE